MATSGSVASLENHSMVESVPLKNESKSQDKFGIDFSHTLC